MISRLVKQSLSSFSGLRRGGNGSVGLRAYCSGGVGFEKAVEYSKAGQEAKLVEYYESHVSEVTVKETKLMNWDVLHWASLKNHQEIVKNVIEARSKMEGASRETVFPTDKYGVSPLHVAIQRNHVESLRTLLEGGINPNTKDKKQGSRLSPLVSAMQMKPVNEEIVKALVDHGADVNMDTLDRKTPIFFACSLSNFNLVKMLVDTNQCKINVQDNPRTNGWEYYRVTSPLHIAVSKGDLEIVKYMVEHGGDPSFNLMDEVGESLMHVCAATGDIEMATFLLAKGANINALDSFEATPLDYASSGRNSNQAMINFLKQNSAIAGKGRKM